MKLGLELMNTPRYAANGIGWIEHEKMCASVDLVNTYMALQTTVKVAIADEPVALRLLSALVLGWDALPLETQIRLVRDASLMDHGFPNTTMGSITATS